VKRGQYKIIRTDGTQTLHTGRVSIREIERLIGCDRLDSVTINPKRTTVMLVDDTGMLDGKPVNRKATKLYRSLYGPGTVHQIHGDVVIVSNTSFTEQATAH
jgi:hypothetical protein